MSWSNGQATAVAFQKFVALVCRRGRQILTGVNWKRGGKRCASSGVSGKSPGPKKCPQSLACPPINALGLPGGRAQHEWALDVGWAERRFSFRLEAVALEAPGHPFHGADTAGVPAAHDGGGKDPVPSAQRGGAVDVGPRGLDVGAFPLEVAHGVAQQGFPESLAAEPRVDVECFQFHLRRILVPEPTDFADLLAAVSRFDIAVRAGPFDDEADHIGATERVVKGLLGAGVKGYDSPRESADMRFRFRVPGSTPSRGANRRYRPAKRGFGAS